jgi:DNA-binding NarL/FixJ family response regulator
MNLRFQLVEKLKAGGLEKVTPAEALVATHLIAGKTDYEIAFEIGRTCNTVKRHLQNMRRRLGMGAPASAVERAILEELALGHTIKKAAVNLGISYSTADSHLCSLRMKFGVHNVAQLLAAAGKAARV